jgi:predicted RNase H-like nuclease (RuvC/YqgF family)
MNTQTRVARLLEIINDYEEYYQKVIEEKCASDERHCTCVPALRQRINDLEGELEAYRQEIEDLSAEAAQQSAHRTCALCGASTWANAIEVNGKEICTLCGSTRRAVPSTNHLPTVPASPSASKNSP